MKFRVVCTDIDGTLLDERRELSPKTIATFQQLPKDVLVILASSRMPAAMRHLQEELRILHQPLICYNGGYVIHYGEPSSLLEMESLVIPAQVCSEILALTSGTDIHTSIYFKDEWIAPGWDRWTDRESTITKVKPVIESIEGKIEYWKERRQGAHKVMCMGPADQIGEMEAKLLEGFTNDIHVYRSRPTYLELAPRQISKGSGLQLLAKAFDFTLQEVIAFGDNYNDVEMLKLAGHGVAVANSRDEVKAVANEITLDSKADGVAVVLEKYFLS